MPLRLQYLLQNIIMAGCMRGIGSGFITWEEAMGNQWVYEYQGSSLRTSGCTSTRAQSENQWVYDNQGSV
ncbi:hypothetical protein NQZ68_030616 [Dissostichus eleginoides]|nr:hypothetical protein NQZ68_030616 [Dissostichus eleginoides]